MGIWERGLGNVPTHEYTNVTCKRIDNSFMKTLTIDVTNFGIDSMSGQRDNYLNCSK